MSYRALFEDAAGRLAGQDWEGKDVKDLVKVLIELWLSEAPISARAPLVINALTNLPPVVINLQGPQNPHQAIRVTNSSRQMSQLGIGLGNVGLFAANLLATPEFFLDPANAHKALSSIGNQGGVTSEDPTDAGDGQSLPSGLVVSQGAGADIGTGLGTGSSGSGVFRDHTNHAVLPGIDRFLAHVQAYTEADFTDPVFLRQSLNGLATYLCTNLHAVQVVRCTIDSISDDYLTCTVVDSSQECPQPGSSITVAKPPELRQTTFDGLTVDGITYTYSDSQNRSADDGVYAAESQVVYPCYKTSTSRATIYAHLVHNQTGENGATQWIDLNVDARKWLKLALYNGVVAC